MKQDHASYMSMSMCMCIMYSSPFLSARLSQISGRVLIADEQCR